jgi:hypothetical protein
MLFIVGAEVSGSCLVCETGKYSAAGQSTCNYCFQIYNGSLLPTECLNFTMTAMATTIGMSSELEIITIFRFKAQYQLAEINNDVQ